MKSKAFAVLQAMEGAMISFSQGESEIRSSVVPSSRLDFLKALVKRGPTCGNSMASRKAHGVDAHLVRTKATHGANSKNVRKFCVVRTCCETLNGMGLSLEGRFVKCANRTNEAQH